MCVGCSLVCFVVYFVIRGGWIWYLTLWIFGIRLDCGYR